MAYYLITGLLLGLTAGISPGPLQTLLIAETLQHNKRAGMLVAIAPLLTDLPIILIAVFIIQKLTGMNIVMGCIALSGAFYLLFLAYGSFTFHLEHTVTNQKSVTSLRKGVVANFLNPHPYLFWMTVGAPTIISALEINIITSVLFILGFYCALIGSLLITAFIVSHTKTFLKQKIYKYIIRILGIVLVILAFLFFREAFQFYSQ